VASKVEIERKFLVADPGIVAGLGGRRLLQGYFGRIGAFHLRLRLVGQEAWVTLKSDAPGIARQEYEASIPPALAARLLGDCPARHKIEKIRYRLRAGGQDSPLPNDPPLTWEIDHFLGRHEGLWLAEIELNRADRLLDLPAWLGAEVTDNPAYRNASLAEAPQGPAVLDPELRGHIAALGPFV